MELEVTDSRRLWGTVKSQGNYKQVHMHAAKLAEEEERDF